MKRTTFIIRILLLFLVSCAGVDLNEERVKEVIRWAPKSAQSELNNFIGHYKYDTKERQVALFLVANLSDKYSERGQMGILYHTYVDSIEQNLSVNNKKNIKYDMVKPFSDKKQEVIKQRDLDCINADSLIVQTDFALKVWTNSLWSDIYPTEVFMAYVAPYRVANEPLEYYWRKNAYQSYKQFLPNDPKIELKRIVANVYENINFSHNNLFWGIPLQSYTENVHYKRGTCNDHAVFTAMIMRAIGIPTAVEIIPFWGDNNNGHSFNSLILPDNSCIGYNNMDDLESGLTLQGKIPKIYRREYELQRKTFLWECKDSEYIPSLFREHELSDVTSQYDIPVKNVCIPSAIKYQTKLAYLCVFAPGRWRPIAWTQYTSNKACFNNVGTGYCTNNTERKGINIGDGILYLPVCYENEEMTPIHHPFILSETKPTRFLKPDTTKVNTVVLSRKFPKKRRVAEWADKMENTQIEVADNRAFRNSVILHHVMSQPHSHMQEIKIDNRKPYKFVRLYKQHGGISIAELKCFDRNNKEIKAKCISDEYLINDAELANISDNSILSYFDVPLNDTWVGLEFDKPVIIDKIAYCPHTDDNDIAPGDSYELFYWNDKWTSLGCQRASDYSLSYENVPENALLWLRDLTKGNEERPFTYENGKQIWW